MYGVWLYGRRLSSEYHSKPHSGSIVVCYGKHSYIFNVLNVTCF